MSGAGLKSMMLKPFRPSLYVSTVFDIDYDSLRRSGKNALLFDLDNTLVARDSEKVTEGLKKLFDDLKKDGFKIVIISNNWGKRVRDFSAEAGVPVLGRAVKPLKRAFRRAMKLIDAGSDETVIIGDQMFTDIYGANRLKLATVLVTPVSEVDLIHTKILRRLEWFILDQLKGLGQLPDGRGDFGD